jgi:hypothetical protein
MKRLGALLALACAALLGAACLTFDARIVNLGNAATYSGEITNTSDQPEGFYRVHLAFLDEEGRTVTTMDVDPCLRTTPAHGSNFFEARIEDIEGPWFGIEASPVFIPRPSGPIVTLPAALALRLNRAEVDHRFERQVLFDGSLRNTSSFTVEEARACIIVRRDGKVERAVRLDLGNLAPGQTIPLGEAFDIERPDLAAEYTVEAWADGVRARPLAPSHSNQITIRP